MPRLSITASLRMPAIVVVLLCGRGVGGHAAEDASWPRFRGPQGDGVSAETGLLQQWPEAGPQLLWTAQGIGEGYASVTTAGGKIFTAGDVGGDLVISALSTGGQILWQVKNGASWTTTGPAGARGTPTLDGDRLYHENAHEEVVCLNAATGQKIWGVNLQQEFHGIKDGYGRGESLVIDGERLICAPGGPTAIAALNKRTGQTVWKSPSVNEPASYVTPILAEYQGLRMILTMSSRSALSVNADTGDLLWRFEHYTPRYVANCVTPIYHDGRVFVTGGYGLGSVLVKISVSGSKATVEPVWRSKDLDNRHGGVILFDGHIYGAAHFNNKGKWVCLEWATGTQKWAERGVGEGAVTCADGLLYTVSEQRKVGLVKPNPTGLDLISQFQIPTGGQGPTWAHPVVCGGRLYLRHGDRLYAYSVARAAAPK